METLESLKTALNAAEQQVLQALADAARIGDLEGIDKARLIVGELRTIAAGLSDDAKSAPPLISPNGATTNRSKPKKRSNHQTRQYPEYHARHETLYRRAWSRKKTSEYEHKAPRQIVDEVVRAMASIAAKDAKPVSVESILAKVNRSSPVLIPQYQVYLVIGWLRHAQKIEQVGRDGYRIPHDIARIAQEQWRELESRSSDNE